MKKSKKIVISIVLGCIIAGAIMSGAGLALGGSFFSEYMFTGDLLKFNSRKIYSENTSADEKLEVKIDAFQTLDLDISYGNIEIMTGDEFALRLEHVPEDRYTITQANGTLTLKSKEEMMFNFGRNKNYKYTIIIPSEVESIRLDSNIGDIKINGIAAEKVEIYQSMGEVYLHDVRIRTSIEVEQHMGDIEIDGICEGDAHFVNSLGDTQINIKGNENEYRYELTTSMGEIEINGRNRGDGINPTVENGNGAHKITAENSMGDISLEFK